LKANIVYFSGSYNFTLSLALNVAQESYIFLICIVHELVSEVNKYVYKLNAVHLKKVNYKQITFLYKCIYCIYAARN